jgi:trehalose synthase-fused probable maltokinase
VNALNVQEASEGEAGAFRRLLEAALPAALPNWLEGRRWFSDKGRPIADVDIEGLHFGRANGGALALVVMQVAFTDGGQAFYFAPLAMTDHPQEAEVIFRNGSALVDATPQPAFGAWLVELLASAATSGDGHWVFASQPGASLLLEAARQQPATVLRGEQSNTSIRYGGAVIVKLVRRLQPAPNPEEEILRGLTGTGFSGVPAYVGAGTWIDDDGTAYPLLLAQAIVPNVGDGWSWTLRRLSDLVAAHREEADDAFAPERLLGQRTAELHVALGQVTGANFAPDLPESDEVERAQRRLHDAALQAIALLRERAGTLTADLRADVPRIEAGLREAATRGEGFAAEADAPRIRVHGDYHLGQTLRTADGDWAIIDFEGEPARPVSERRQKTSALKDVAGMLRSFAYARGAAARSLANPRDQTAQRRLREWEQGAREAFLEGYREVIKAAPMSLVPEDEPSFRQALAAWEIDKALYEIAYEARNRPDWIEIPLLALLPGEGDRPASP